MKTTSKCWLIANFEIIVYVFALIVSAILAIMVFGFSNVNSESVLKGFAYSAIVAGSISIPTKRGVFQFGKYLLIVGMGILVPVLIAKNEELDAQSQKILTGMIILFWIVFILASVVSAVLAVYTYRNIGEVLSRRMLYRNSRVAIF
jgi:hypothetical protein